MKKIFGFLFIMLAAGVWADSEVTIERARSSINAGFRERVYIDGKQVLNLANGASGKVKVSSGTHEIYAQLYTLETPKLSFTAGSVPLKFIITPYAMSNFVVELDGPPPASDLPEDDGGKGNSVVDSLKRAADTIMEKIPRGSIVAIVYVTAADPEVAEFIAGDLEVHILNHGLTVVDRSELDQIRKEHELQTSGEVDDTKAVSIGKFAGASVIITGAVTGTGELRRLRLRVLDTQDTRVLTGASVHF
jgi:hypothetical protein